MKSPSISSRFAVAIITLCLVTCVACAANSPLAFLAQPAPPPSAAIIRLADAATMTDKARQILYAAQPVIDTDRATFDRHCQAQVSPNSVELGCYTSDNHIYILNINSSQLSEEMEVVAAHEMLHAAYAQLSSTELTTLNTQLENAITQLHSPELTRQLRSYRASEPGQRDNELHSILGTEYAPLDPALEQYYGQYFSRRQVIVNAAQQFNQTFAQIESTLTHLRAEISQTRREATADLRRHDLTAYNTLVPQLNTLIKQYNQDLATYNLLSGSLLGEESNTLSP